MDAKDVYKLAGALLVVLGLVYWYAYRPAHIKDICLQAYPDSVPSRGSLPRLPNPFGPPDYSTCLKSHGL